MRIVITHYADRNFAKLATNKVDLKSCTMRRLGVQLPGEAITMAAF